MNLLQPLTRLGAMVGFHTLWDSSRDLKVLILLRMVRLFAYGGTTLILALYLSALNFRDEQIGLFMTLTLVGDLLVGLVLTYIGDRMGVRLTIVIGSLLMVVGGVALASLENYWLLLLASIAAVVNPSANEVDPFKAIEESAIARLSTPENCSDFFAWWSLLGMFGTAASTLLAGVLIDVLQTKGGLTILHSYRIIFLAYAGIGILKLLCGLFLSPQVEIAYDSVSGSQYGQVADEVPDDCRPLLDNDPILNYSTIQSEMSNAETAKLKETSEPERMFSPESVSFMWRFSLAMAFDFVGSGLAQVSWMIYFFKRSYDVSEGSLGLAAFVASIFSSALNLVSSPLSRRIGQVPTMVLCHTLNSISLLMVSVPNNRNLALFLFMVRIITREIDNAPRQAFISASVQDAERTSAMGVVNIVKTVGSCLGLFLTGLFAGQNNFWIAFTLAGCLKLSYNALISFFFWRPRTPRSVK